MRRISSDSDIVEALAVRLRLDSYSLYVQDYGAPVGFRLAVRHPERVRAIETRPALLAA